MTDWEWLDQVYSDARLSARDKAAYTVILMRRDQTGEYRLGLRALSRLLGVRWTTAKQSLDRLVDYGYCVPIQANTRWIAYHPLVPQAEADPPAPLPPTQAPRMAMPKEVANDIVWWLAYARRMLEAATVADMAGVKDRDRMQWMAEADRITELMDLFARWMVRFGGGIEPSLRPLLDSSSDLAD